MHNVGQNEHNFHVTQDSKMHHWFNTNPMFQAHISSSTDTEYHISAFLILPANWFEHLDNKLIKLIYNRLPPNWALHIKLALIIPLPNKLLSLLQRSCSQHKPTQGNRFMLTECKYDYFNTLVNPK